MLNVDLYEKDGFVVLSPDGELSKSNFEAVAEIVDPYIEKHGKLNGLIIYVEKFQGWDSFSSLITHLKFVKDHHKKITRIAFTTDSSIGSVAASCASHFVKAEVKSFPFSELEAAKEWVLGGAE